MPFEVVTLKSGALAMRSIDDGEVMHPGVGPRIEAEALYVRQSRLAERLLAGPVVLFDVGLGAGSNALAARAVALERPSLLTLISFERELGALRLALDHRQAFGFDAASATAARTLLDEGRHPSVACDWWLVQGELLPALAAEPRRADIVFWDPFSPRVNPELWTVAAFCAVRRTAQNGCVLVTYSASTATRVALLLAGWSVGIGDSIGEKRQTTIAIAGPAATLARPLDRGWLTRLFRPDAPLPSDAPPDAAQRVSELPQFEVSSASP